MIEKCIPKPAIAADSWEIGKIAMEHRKIIENFQEDLLYFGQNLPPSFGRFPQWTNNISRFNLIQFDLMVLRVNIIKNIEKENWQFIIDNENEIVKGAELDYQFMDKDTLTLIIETLIKKSHLHALSIGLKIGHILGDQQNFDFSSLSYLMGLLIFPSVFETNAWLPTYESIRSKQLDRRYLIEQYLQYIHDLKGGMEENDQAPVYASTSNKPGRKRMAYIAQNTSDTSKFEQFEARNKAIYPITSDAHQILPMISLEVYNIKF